MRPNLPIDDLPRALGFRETKELKRIRGQLTAALASGPGTVTELAAQYHTLAQALVDQTSDQSQRPHRVGRWARALLAHILGLEVDNFDRSRAQIGLIIAMALIRRDTGRNLDYIVDLEDAVDYAFNAGFADIVEILQEELKNLLEFSDGWHEILESPQYADYQMSFNQLINLTQHNLPDETWTKDRAKVCKRWQHLIEQAAYAAISVIDIKDMSSATVIEWALIIVTANLKAYGWEEEGISFNVPESKTGEAILLDIREV